MSHLASGFCVTDIEALALTVKEKCPELELVKQKHYRTWTTDHGGRLVGDYPLPGLYQLKLMASLKRQGVDVHAKAEAQGSGDFSPLWAGQIPESRRCLTA